jgi:hypothetical protein
MNSLTTKRLLVVSVALSFIILLLVALIYFRSMQTSSTTSGEGAGKTPSSTGIVSPSPELLQSLTVSTTVVGSLPKQVSEVLAVPAEYRKKQPEPLPPDVKKSLTVPGY